MNSKHTAIITNPQTLLLHTQLEDYISKLDIKNNLTAEVKRNMARSLASFTELSVSKFIAGQAEHGGDLRDRDLSKELAAEQIDSFWYGPFGAMSWLDKPQV